MKMIFIRTDSKTKELVKSFYREDIFCLDSMEQLQNCLKDLEPSHKCLLFLDLDVDENLAIKANDFFCDVKHIYRFLITGERSLNELKTHQLSAKAAHGYIRKPLSLEIINGILNDLELADYIIENEIFEEGTMIGEATLTKLNINPEFDDELDDADENLTDAENTIKTLMQEGLFTGNIEAYQFNTPINQRIQKKFDMVFLSKGPEWMPEQEEEDGLGFQVEAGAGQALEVEDQQVELDVTKDGDGLAADELEFETPYTQSVAANNPVENVQNNNDIFDEEDVEETLLLDNYAGENDLQIEAKSKGHASLDISEAMPESNKLEDNFAFEDGEDDIGEIEIPDEDLDFDLDEEVETSVESDQQTKLDNDDISIGWEAESAPANNDDNEMALDPHTTSLDSDPSPEHVNATIANELQFTQNAKASAPSPTPRTALKTSAIPHEDALRWQETLRQMREERQSYEQEIEQLQQAKKHLEQKNLDLKAENEELKIEINIVKQRRQAEIEDLKDQLKIVEEKAQITETKLKQLQKNYEQNQNNVRINVNKVRQREKELENRLELVTMDSEAQIKTRDLKILELKRKIDALEFNMENSSIKEQKSRTDKEKLEEKLSKIMRTLRSSIKLLEDDLEEYQLEKAAILKELESQEIDES